MHDCCVNRKDQEITRRVIVAESLFVKMVAEPTQPFLSAGRPFQESREGGDCCVNSKDQEITR